MRIHLIQIILWVLLCCPEARAQTFQNVTNTPQANQIGPADSIIGLQNRTGLRQYPASAFLLPGRPGDGSGLTNLNVSSTGSSNAVDAGVALAIKLGSLIAGNGAGLTNLPPAALAATNVGAPGMAYFWGAGGTGYWAFASSGGSGKAAIFLSENGTTILTSENGTTKLTTEY